MCRRFDQNKERFIDLVYELNEFSEKEITKTFFEINREIIIDEHASIRDVLDNLREIGSLEYDGTKYCVVSEDKRLRFNPFSFHVLT